MPSSFSRGQDKYERFDQLNSLEKKVKKSKMDRIEADKLMAQILATGHREKEELKRKLEAQGEEHR